MAKQNSESDSAAAVRLRRLRKWSIVLLPAALLSLFGSIALGMIDESGICSACVMTLGWILLCAFMICGLLAARARCPRCGKLFHKPEGFRGHFAPISLSSRRCVHCGYFLDDKVS